MQRRDAFARYEHLLDRRMSTEPISALCAFDVAELGHSAVAELACLHPFTSDGASPFRLYADQAPTSPWKVRSTSAASSYLRWP